MKPMNYLTIWLSMLAGGAIVQLAWYHDWATLAEQAYWTGIAFTVAAFYPKWPTHDARREERG